MDPFSYVTTELRSINGLQPISMDEKIKLLMEVFAHEQEGLQQDPLRVGELIVHRFPEQTITTIGHDVCIVSRVLIDPIVPMDKCSNPGDLFGAAAGMPECDIVVSLIKDDGIVYFYPAASIHFKRYEGGVSTDG